MLGDNAYGSGYDPQYQAYVFDFYTPWLQQLPLWSYLGNHDTYSGERDGKLDYERIFVFPTVGECGVASGTERYYSWDRGNVHFVVLDSMTADRSPVAAMVEWLNHNLAANFLPWTIAAWHHLPYTHGSHNSDLELDLIQMRNHIVPILESQGVDLILNSHSHS